MGHSVHRGQPFEKEWKATCIKSLCARHCAYCFIQNSKHTRAYSMKRSSPVTHFPFLEATNVKCFWCILPKLFFAYVSVVLGIL